MRMSDPHCLENEFMPPPHALHVAGQAALSNAIADQYRRDVLVAAGLDYPFKDLELVNGLGRDHDKRAA